MKKIFIRQGDIMFESVPEGGLEKTDPLETKTIALGEITGHHHSFRKNDQVLLYKNPQQDMPSQTIVQQDLSTELQHQEHFSIQFPKGEYIIKREQSYNPFLKQIQRSID